MKNLERLEAEIAYRESLVRALAPDPSEYEYGGLNYDSGPRSNEHCACGHPIRLVFMIERERDGKTAKIGSTCINHFGAISPGQVDRMVADYNAMVERIKEDERRAKELQKQGEVAGLEAEYARIHEIGRVRYQAYQNAGRRAPYELYWAYGCYSTRLPKTCNKTYKTTNGFIGWYKKHIEILRSVLGNILNGAEINV